MLHSFVPNIELKAHANKPDKLPYGVEQIGAELMWEEGYQGEGIKVAVLDTGVPEHKDIEVKEGFNFVPMERETDTQGHATHVAGSVLADSTLTDGIDGVAPKAELYAGKVLADDGSGDNRWIARGIKWARDKDIHVINLSLGTYIDDETIEKEIIDAYNEGIIIVAASGNEGKMGISYPAAYKEVLAVAAVDVEQERPDFSSIGKENEICAPGVEVLSTYPGDGYAILCGTSMACPHIVGAAALLIQKYGVMEKHELRDLMYASTIDLGKGKYYGEGLFSFKYKEREV